jgi:hypothetical protein
MWESIDRDEWGFLFSKLSSTLSREYHLWMGDTGTRRIQSDNHLSEHQFGLFLLVGTILKYILG